MIKAEAIKAGKAAKKAKFSAQTIIINADWRIVRPDERNWEVQHKRTFKGYYGTLLNAFQALPAKMLDEVAKDGLNEVQRSQRAITAEIQTALAKLK